jgi:hypothetical protein
MPAPGNKDLPIPSSAIDMRDGRAVWYVLTDTDDRGNADTLGLNWSAKLTYTGVDQAVRNATLAPDATLIFEKGALIFALNVSLYREMAQMLFCPKSLNPDQSMTKTIARWCASPMQVITFTTHPSLPLGSVPTRFLFATATQTIV